MPSRRPEEIGLMSHREKFFFWVGAAAAAAVVVLSQAKYLHIHPLHPTAHHRPHRSLFPPPVFHVTIKSFSSELLWK